ncbi:sodium-dependent nutrient amino acid transporter 1 isoform X2 [Cephus cinctus]|uniref:Transporter n=1 Tax=Cephus cinctus TaxID=211228 RepID=A0AAJ7FGP0_CEPCN|nr:sodium-dependent nutrient amino acid transporter 1 isoform X2 [Cephus cinctus]
MAQQNEVEPTGLTNEAFEGENGEHTEIDKKRKSSIPNTKANGNRGKLSVISIISTNSIKRDEWSGGLEFLMSCIATSVGLGNIWRFPFTAYENGGGAFLIPYIIVLLLIGKPMYYLECSLGQFSSKSCVKVWALSPAMKGIGYGQLIAAFCVVTYYCVLMALTLFYLAMSFQRELPWSYCRDEWAGFCFDAKSNTSLSSDGNQTISSSAELYYRLIILNEKQSIDDGIGWPSWKLSLCLFFSWLVVFGVLSRGVKSSGKAAYFLAIFPYIVMIILLVRAVTLQGAGNGILFFITPDWNKLWEPTVWYAAVTQCFFSLSICFGSLIMYSSYNNFAHNVRRDVMIVTTLDTFTSLIAGCTIFGILGNLAHENGSNDVSSVVRGGSGLAFISYPEALSRFTVVPQLFSVLFFIMMFVLGTGSAMALVGGVFSVLCDKFPKIKQWKIILIVSIVGFLIGQIYVTPGGQWMLTLVDYYAGTFIPLIVAVTQLITVFWIYGLSNFLNDIEFMLGYRPGLYWRLCWFLINPILMLIILIYTMATYVPPKYDGMVFPNYAYAIGWTIVGIGTGQMLFWISVSLVKNRTSSILETIKKSFTPSHKWGPKNSKKKREWRLFTEEKKSKSEGGIYNLLFK